MILLDTNVLSALMRDPSDPAVVAWLDAQEPLIGGVALARHAVVATRNVRHYADLDTGVVDPWSVEPGR